MKLLLLCLLHALHDLGIGHFFLLCLLILFHHLVDDLTFFQSAMSDGCQYRFPVAESIFSKNTFLILRLYHLSGRNALHLTILGDQFFSFCNIAFLELCLEPLVDLIFCLRTLNGVEPVTAGSFGVLGCNDLDPVTILDHRLDRHQLSVDSGTNHLVADRTVDTICKVNGIGAIGQRLHIATWCKAVYTLGEQIQITL